MNKIIIGLVGEIAAGKDTIADYLAENYQAQTFSFSQPLRDILDILYQEQSRINIATLGNILRQAFGQDLLSKIIAAKVKNSSAEIIVLPNVRLASDIVYLADEPGFVLVGVETDQATRFERLKNRRQNTDDQTKTWEQFLADAELTTELQIRDLIKKSAYRLDNNQSKEQLYQQVEELITKLKQG